MEKYSDIPRRKLAARSMTYGTLPSKTEFGKAFDKEVPDGRYNIQNLSREDSRAAEGTIIGDGDYSEDELYKGVKQLIEKMEAGDDAAGDLASSIMTTLGFEWI